MQILFTCSFEKFFGRGARVAEWDGIENRCTGNCTEGWNPSLSALPSVAKSEGGLQFSKLLVKTMQIVYILKCSDNTFYTVAHQMLTNARQDTIQAMSIHILKFVWEKILGFPSQIPKPHLKLISQSLHKRMESD